PMRCTYPASAASSRRACDSDGDAATTFSSRASPATCEGVNPRAVIPVVRRAQSDAGATRRRTCTVTSRERTAGQACKARLRPVLRALACDVGFAAYEGSGEFAQAGVELVVGALPLSLGDECYARIDGRQVLDGVVFALDLADGAHECVHVA